MFLPLATFALNCVQNLPSELSLGQNGAGLHECELRRHEQAFEGVGEQVLLARLQCPYNDLKCWFDCQSEGFLSCSRNVPVRQSLVVGRQSYVDVVDGCVHVVESRPDFLAEVAIGDFTNPRFVHTQ